MSISEELKQLEAMLEKGTLTQEEFQRAKERVLNTAQPGPSAADLEDLKIQGDINQLDLEWIQERERHLIRGEPPVSNAITFILFGFLVFLGIVMTVGGTGQWIGTLPRKPDLFLLVCGPLLVVFFVGMGIHNHVRTTRYKAALQIYKHRRNALIDRQLGNPPRG